MKNILLLCLAYVLLSFSALAEEKPHTQLELDLATALADEYADWNGEASQVCKAISGSRATYQLCMAAALISREKQPKDKPTTQPP